MSNVQTAISAIDAEITHLEGRVEFLRSTREALANGAIESAVPTVTAAKPAKRLTGAAKAAHDRKAAKQQESTTKATKGAAKRNGKSSSKGGETRAEQIMRLTAEGKSAGEIADMLGTHRGYVYTVRRKHGAE